MHNVSVVHYKTIPRTVRIAVNVPKPETVHEYSPASAGVTLNKRAMRFFFVSRRWLEGEFHVIFSALGSGL